MKNHKLGSLKQQFLSPNVWNEGVSSSPGIWWLLTMLCRICLLLCSHTTPNLCLHPHMAFSFPCVSLHISFFCAWLSLYLFSSSFFFKIDFYSFMFNYFCLHCVIALHGLSLVAVSKGYSLFAVYGLLFSMVLLLQSTGSRDHGLSSCGTWA